MAIRFVDKEPEGQGPEAAKPARAPRARPEASAPAPIADHDGEAALAVPPPGLTHAKPEPKQRGRKAPMAQVAVDEVRPGHGASTEDADGLLPGLQFHAKPTPKPRGRKKAFG